MVLAEEVCLVVFSPSIAHCLIFFVFSFFLQ